MDGLEERRGQLRAALAEEWEHELRESPEFATIIGDYRYNDRWSDLSLSHVEQEKRDLAAWLSRFEAIAPAGFTEQEELDRRLIIRKLEERLEEIAFRDFEMPVDQLEGIHLQWAQFVSFIPFASVEHYEAYRARLTALPGVVEQVIEVMRQGQEDGLMPPRYLLEKAAAQCRSLAEPAGEANVFGRPVAGIPAVAATPQRERLRADLLAAVDRQVRPAYQRLADFIVREYAPKGRSDAGIWSLPDGEERYRSAVRRLTTSDLGPDEIHELGLQEVARIEAEQAAIVRSLGATDLKAFRAALKTDPRLIPGSREQILEAYRHYIAQMQAELPKLFGLLPEVALEVRPVQEYREKEAAGAEYHPGTPDGSRPGIVYVCTGDYEQRSLSGVESTAYHEGLPGHHLQATIAQSLPSLPPFRQHAYYGAYVEGWALYSERLGKEIGFYQDPYSDLGRLSNELLRAARLVLDTGVHHKRWTREQTVDYFREHSWEDEPDLQVEVDRYLVLPAQALTYKIGELAIRALRERAERELGSGYDIRAFHDRVLDGGALPLDLLEERVVTGMGFRGARVG
jgi:uncharacterized protein (DUF885 family)